IVTFGQFQILKDGSFGPYCDVITLESSKRYPTEGHIPAVEVAVNAEPCHGNFFLPEVISGVKLNLPFGCQAKIAVDVKRSGNRRPVSGIGVLKAEGSGQVPGDVEVDKCIGIGTDTG